MAQRVWTLAEANGAIFRIEEMMREAQSYLVRMQAVQLRLEQLRTEFGDAIVMADHQAHGAYKQALEEFHHVRRHLGTNLRGFDDLGVEVKDVGNGLVDFRAEIGGTEVYLCWVQGEPAVTHWHTLDAGFAGRKKIPDLESASA